jgi:CheY-like chemotaxis protein
MNKKLLLADDSVTIQKVVGIICSGENIDLTTVSNGDAALQEARLRRPDLILADVVMPGKNGYELCAAVKQEPELRNVPVLLLTGAFEPFDEARARMVGADGWIAKPFESQALLDKVEDLLVQAMARPVPPVAEPAAPAAPAAADMWEELPGFQEPEPFVTTPASEPEFADAGPAAVGWDDRELAEVVAARDSDALGDNEPHAAAFGDWSPEIQEPLANPPGMAADMLSDSESWPEDDDDEILFLDESDIMEEYFEAEPDLSGLDAPVPTALDAGLGADAVPSLDELMDEEDLAVPAFPPTMDEPQGAPQWLSYQEPQELEEEIGEPEVDELAGATWAPLGEEEPSEVAETSGTAASGMEHRGANGLAFFQDSGLISRLAQPAAEVPEETAAADFRFEDTFAEAPAITVATDFRDGGLAAWQETPAIGADEVSAAAPGLAEPAEPAGPVLNAEERLQALSEEDLTRIVERVAGQVLERLAGSIVERVVWEVVPDLAESMIKDEIARIRAEAQ